ncbi:MAG: hypothetical protein ABH852_06410 [Methanobacteriota archaeon]
MRSWTMAYRRKKKEIKPHIILGDRGESEEHLALRKKYTSLTWKNAEEKRKILKKLGETE